MLCNRQYNQKLVLYSYLNKNRHSRKGVYGMKKAFLVIIPIIMLMGCAGSPTPVATSSSVMTQDQAIVATSSSVMTLDQAIKEASDEIDGRFEANSKIALVNFNSSSDQFSVYVLDELPQIW